MKDGAVIWGKIKKIQEFFGAIFSAFPNSAVAGNAIGFTLL
jgi:hypothetical protein